MLTLGRAPLVPGDGHNITQNTRWPVHAAQKAFLTFTHLSAFYAFAKKKKIFLRQTLAEHIPWELITPGDVRNSSSLNTHSALVGNSFWDYVITGIVLGDPCHWYNAGSDNLWHTWSYLDPLECSDSAPATATVSAVSIVSTAQCRLWCGCCSWPSALTLPAPISWLCLLFITFSGRILSRASVFSVSEPQICSAVDTGPLCLLSQPRSYPGLLLSGRLCHCFNQILLMNLFWLQPQPPGFAWVHSGRLSPLSLSFCHRSLKSRQSWPWHGCTGGQHSLLLGWRDDGSQGKLSKDALISPEVKRGDGCIDRQGIRMTGKGWDRSLPSNNPLTMLLLLIQYRFVISETKNCVTTKYHNKYLLQRTTNNSQNIPPSLEITSWKTSNPVG